MDPCIHFAELDCSTFSTNGAAIHIDECTLCFAQATDAEGVDLCLHCFNGSCRLSGGHTSLHHLKTSHLRFINVQRKMEKEGTEQPALTKLAVGGDDGANHLLGFKNTYSLRCEECKMNFAVPETFERVIHEIESSASAFETAKIEAWELGVNECKHAREMGKIAPTAKIQGLPTQCGACDIKANLWMCLTCGVAGCGRAQFSGDKGNGHALSHYRLTHHSVVVKIGTLGQGDDLKQASAYCYQCDEETIVSGISGALLRLGLSLHGFKKTEKTVAQMNLHANQNFELSRAFEKNLKMATISEQLRPPGLFNLGNSCYINALLQALFSTRMLTELVPKGKAHIETCKRAPSECFVCQFAKVASFLTEKKWRGHIGRPFMFKYLVGKGHPEFKSERQQDVCEYFIHLKGFLAQAEESFQKRLVSAFSFQSATILTCSGCAYFYAREDQSFLLNVKFTPTQLADLSAAAVDKPQAFAFRELIEKGVYVGSEQLFCERCQAQKSFAARQFIKTFPDVLVVVVQIMHANQAQAVKLHYDLRLEESNSFEGLNFAGAELDAARKMSSNTLRFNQAALKELTDMGFSEENCKKALLQAGNNFDTALNLLLSTTPELCSDHCDERLSRLLSFCGDLGISPDVLKVALERYKNMRDEEIVNMILSDPSMFEDAKNSLPKNYGLVAGVVHLGRDINSGHYITYAKRSLGEAQKTWLYFNDDSVNRVEETSVGRSYMLFFEKNC